MIFLTTGTFQINVNQTRKANLQIPKVVAPTPDSKQEDSSAGYARKLDFAIELERGFFATVKAGILATTF